MRISRALKLDKNSPPIPVDLIHENFTMYDLVVQSLSLLRVSASSFPQTQSTWDIVVYCFHLGDESDVILGVDEAVKTMKKGEISFITADSSYGFGDEGRPEWNIAPGATVEYEVHLKSFEPVCPNTCMYYFIPDCSTISVRMRT